MTNDCIFCEQSFVTKGELVSHTKACRLKFQEGRNLAPNEDDLMHVNRLFWPLNPTQLVRVQKRIVPLRSEAKSQQTLKQKMAEVAMRTAAGQAVTAPQFRNLAPGGGSYGGRQQIRGQQLSVSTRYNAPAGMMGGGGRMQASMFAGGGGGGVAPLGTLNSLVQQLQRFNPASGAAGTQYSQAQPLGSRQAFQQKSNSNPQALPSSLGALHFCELCDGGLTSLDHYRIHLQVSILRFSFFLFKFT